jgi:arsenate reductase (thioredoxin)
VIAAALEKSVFSFRRASIQERKESGMPPKDRILFICRHNSGRSQIAAAYLEKHAGSHFEVESAGFEPAEKVDPLVVAVMSEEGIDLSEKKPQSVFDLYKTGRLYAHVITVCHGSETQCPIFPGITHRWHFPFPDPAEVQGTTAEKLAQVRRIRDAIKKWLLEPGSETAAFKTLIEK